MLTWKKWEQGSLDWDDLLMKFDDYNIYQSYHWGEYKKTLGWSPIRIIAYENDKIVSLAQILIRKYKFGVVLAWTPGGPVGDFSSLNSQFWLCLKSIAGARFLYCRINPMIKLNDTNISELKFHGWKKSIHQILSGMSLIYNPSLEESVRRSNTSKNWRHNLKRSGKYEHVTTQWLEADIDEILEIYNSMQSYKNIAVQVTREELEGMQKHFQHNYIVTKCVSEEGDLLAIRAALILGIKGWDILAAASPQARKVYASHAAFWELMNICNMRDVNLYDMSGADPINNLGVYNFKKGTGAQDVIFLGEWDKASFYLLRLVANFLIKWRLKNV